MGVFKLALSGAGRACRGRGSHGQDNFINSNSESLLADCEMTPPASLTPQGSHNSAVPRLCLCHTMGHTRIDLLVSHFRNTRVTILPCQAVTPRPRRARSAHHPHRAPSIVLPGNIPQRSLPSANKILLSFPRQTSLPEPRPSLDKLCASNLLPKHASTLLLCVKRHQSNSFANSHYCQPDAYIASSDPSKHLISAKLPFLSHFSIITSLGQPVYHSQRHPPSNRLSLFCSRHAQI